MYVYIHIYIASQIEIGQVIRRGQCVAHPYSPYSALRIRASIYIQLHYMDAHCHILKRHIHRFKGYFHRTCKQFKRSQQELLKTRHLHECRWRVSSIMSCRWRVSSIMSDHAIYLQWRRAVACVPPACANSHALTRKRTRTQQDRPVP